MPLQKRLWLDNEQGVFPGPNRPCQKNQEHPVRFGTGRSFHLSPEDNQLLAQEHVFCHEFGLASLKVCQRPKPGERWYPVLSRRRGGSGATEDKSLSTV